MDDFFTHWFRGFQKSLTELDDNSRSMVLKECGKACSDSYTRQVYLNAWERSNNNLEFLEELKKAFPELSIEVVSYDHSYRLKYNYCACDLVKNNLVNTPLLCECSAKSLLYNWETIYGDGNVTVELVSSILSGAPCCEFLITIANPPSYH